MEEKELVELEQLLTDCIEYFKVRADAVKTGSDFVPNIEMHLQYQAEQALELVREDLAFEAANAAVKAALGDWK